MSEVKNVVFSIHDHKSLGPDGINSKFMKLHREEIKFDLHAAMIDIF